jgi:hypothetical protein
MKFITHKIENTAQEQTFSAPYLKRLVSEYHLQLLFCFPKASVNAEILPFALQLNVNSPIVAIDFRI